MVQKHLEKMQADKEAACMEKLAGLMPQLGASVRVLALQESSFDVERAVNLLRQYMADNDEKLKTLQKKRKRVHEAAEEAENEVSEDSSGSGSDSDSSGSSDSEDSRDRRKGKKSRSKRKHSSKRKDKKRSKKKKQAGRDKAKSAALTHSTNFGKYGIIRETDAAAKRSEFILWALDVKKIDVEVMGRNEEREMFRDYIEDYNTGTLPHRKYYNLEAYEKYKAAKRAAKGQPATKRSAVNDEEELRRQRAEEAAKLREQRLMEAYQELKYSDKAKDMKEQEMLRLQMQNAYKTGDRALAEKLLARLMPDEEKKK